MKQARFVVVAFLFFPPFELGQQAVGRGDPEAVMDASDALDRALDDEGTRKRLIATLEVKRANGGLSNSEAIAHEVAELRLFGFSLRSGLTGFFRVSLSGGSVASGLVGSSLRGGAVLGGLSSGGFGLLLLG